MARGCIAWVGMLTVALMTVGCAKKPAESTASADGAGAAEQPLAAQYDATTGSANGQMPGDASGAASPNGTLAESASRQSSSDQGATIAAGGAQQNTASQADEAAAAKFQPTQLIELMMRPMSSAMQASMQTMMQSMQGAAQSDSSSESQQDASAEKAAKGSTPDGGVNSSE